MGAGGHDLIDRGVRRGDVGPRSHELAESRWRVVDVGGDDDRTPPRRELPRVFDERRELQLVRLGIVRRPDEVGGARHERADVRAQDASLVDLRHPETRVRKAERGRSS